MYPQHTLSERIALENRFHVEARSLSTFPGQHHPVPYSQADILNARVGLDETVEGDALALQDVFATVPVAILTR